jgi:drug/metabolite transporter (DMT)-like permease
LGVVLLAPLAQFPGVHATLETWLILATVGFVHTGIVYILMYDAIHKLPTHLQGALSFFNPVVAVVVDTFAFGHSLQPMQLAGIATIIVAAAGMNGLFRSWTWPGVPRLAERN